MGRKTERKKGAARMVNVEIAPGNQKAMDAYISNYNARPDRRTPRLKYTDVVNDALHRFFERNLPRDKES